ncbi:IPExxxVDY family protein [Flavobacterium chuncheonense]|uniref:IPExxxVDY family protein n=1 Tax=Flavobacterium chuncheonense TaxID=2026653 RepID=A0ABW5YM46_9FLAO
MAIHKIQINDFISIDYELIAIHTSLEDNRLAYFLNQLLAIQLTKNNVNLEIKSKEGKSSFTHFCYEDVKLDIVWNLIENKTSIISFPSSGNGFFESIAMTSFVLPEFKKADFILKIENTESDFQIQNTIDTISKIKQVSLVYSIDQNKLKSKNNLIF